MILILDHSSTLIFDGGAAKAIYLNLFLTYIFFFSTSSPIKAETFP